MKHLWIALGLLAAVLLCSFCSVQVLSRSTEAVSASLSQAQEHAQRGDYAAAAQQVSRAQELWEEAEAPLGVLLHHEETDEIRFQLAALSAAANPQEPEDFLCRCAELLARLEHLKELDRPRYYNIL